MYKMTDGVCEVEVEREELMVYPYFVGLISFRESSCNESRVIEEDAQVIEYVKRGKEINYWDIDPKYDNVRDYLMYENASKLYTKMYIEILRRYISFPDELIEIPQKSNVYQLGEPDPEVEQPEGCCCCMGGTWCEETEMRL